MNRQKKGLLLALSLICVAGAAFCGLGLYRELKPRMEAESFYEDLRRMAFAGESGKTQNENDAQNGAQPGGISPERTAPDWDALRAFNPDICGWIYSPGTVIDYPIVQGTDNEWYLNHTVDGAKSVIGSVFLESRNQPDFSDDVSVIYGHHIRGGRMFTPISGYKDQKYYSEHPVMYLYTPEADYRVELFAGNILDGSTGSFPMNFADEAAQSEWLDKLMKNSTFRGADAPVYGERILTLCTCTYEYRDARYAVYGKLEQLEIED